VLLAMGIEPTLAQTAIRFTLPAPLEGPEGEALLDRVLEVLTAEVATAAGKRGAASRGAVLNQRSVGSA
jgi:hypothetical protein